MRGIRRRRVHRIAYVSVMHLDKLLSDTYINVLKDF